MISPRARSSPGPKPRPGSTPVLEPLEHFVHSQPPGNSGRFGAPEVRNVREALGRCGSISVSLGGLKQRAPHVNPWASRRTNGSGSRPWRFAVVVSVVTVLFLSSVPIVVSDGDGAATICGCGCGNLEGRCCCSAPAASGLSFSCSERDDPNEPIESAAFGKFIGPAESTKLIRPMPVDARPIMTDDAIFRDGPL